VGFTHRTFWKMTGSGNDFVFFDARSEPAGQLERADAIAIICDRRRGIGADGVVFLEPDPEHTSASGTSIATGPWLSSAAMPRSVL
jgi:diaminopimelate epimerase